MTFDLERAQREGCCTRDGRPVRIICTDIARANDEDGVVIAIRESQGSELVYCCDRDGGTFNLVNLPESHEVTVQLWRNEAGKDVMMISELNIEQIISNHVPSYWEPISQPKTVRIEK